MMPGAIFVGYQSGEALSTCYASSDVLVFPSTTETFGNVIVEAMASGIPAITSNVGGCKGSVRDGVTGFITKAKDPEDIAGKIEPLLNNPDLRKQMGWNAHCYAQTQTWERFFGELFASYREVCSNDFSRYRNFC
jgi:glycosyltransferase involved in cell wall biosynthesis